MWWERRVYCWLRMRACVSKFVSGRRERGVDEVFAENEMEEVMSYIFVLASWRAKK